MLVAGNINKMLRTCKTFNACKYFIHKHKNTMIMYNLFYAVIPKNCFLLAYQLIVLNVIKWDITSDKNHYFNVGNTMCIIRCNVL